MVLESCKLVDLGFIGYPYTWNNKRLGAANTRQRLDRAVANDGWREKYQASTVTHLFSHASDHRPLVLQTKSDWRVHNKGPQAFKFEESWLMWDDSEKMVLESWNKDESAQSGMHNIKERIRNCGSELLAWVSSKTHPDAEEIKKLQKQVEELSMAEQTEENKTEFLAASKKLDDILLRQEIYWAQHSRIAWLKHGDKNTKFFHSKASQRRRRNMIHGVRDQQNIWVDEVEDIANVATNYFENLFSLGSCDRMEECLEVVQHKVTPNMKEILSRDYSAEEIKAALFQMGPTKAPGPYGMNAIFYQKFWHIVGDDVIAAVLDFLNSGNMNFELNYTNIVLIPRNKSPERMSDYRPISLCNIIYKIIFKIMANRLKHILPNLISLTQSAFVPGRLITDNVLVAYETLHSMHCKKKGKKGALGLKLDISKACDRVKWAFLEKIMYKLGFPEAWIERVMSCVSTLSFLVCINGKAYDNIIPTRGLRQGDPLSPYLFLLCAKRFTALLTRAKEEGRLHGVSLCRRAPRITHLLFADDSLLFCQANQEEVQCITDTVQLYAASSGQCINFEKSFVYFSSNTKVAQREGTKAALGVKDVESFESYLGLPTLIGRAKYQTFSFLKD